MFLDEVLPSFELIVYHMKMVLLVCYRLAMLLADDSRVGLQNPA